jgi:Class III cytochrome C family
MMRRWVLVVIAANLIGLAALIFLYPHLMVAPGSLIPAHVSLQTNCFACHSPFRGAVAERCITCHKVAEIGLNTTTGTRILKKSAATPFHQSLTSQNCMACHTDHSNAAFTQQNSMSFSHALLNATIRENCTSCHTAPATAVHIGITGQCSQCHSQESWKSATFDHTRFFVLDRNHNAACTTCHTTSDKRQYTCYGCHEHTEANIRAKHVREGIFNFSNCVNCHRSARVEGEGGSEGDD